MTGNLIIAGACVMGLVVVGYRYLYLKEENYLLRILLDAQARKLAGGRASALVPPPPQADPRDPRWEWTQVSPLGDPTPSYAKGSCRHLALEQVGVRTITGELIGRLCRTCDTAFIDDSFLEDR